MDDKITKLNYEPLDVAIYFLRKEEMSKFRLSKFIYFAFCWSIVYIDAYLFNEDIEAREKGPVIPSVQDFFDSDQDKISINSLSKEQLKHSKKFTEDEERVLDIIYDKYAKLSDSELSYITHEDNQNPTPWHQAYKKGKTVIPKNIIIEYYRKLKLNETLASIENIKSYRNKDKRLEEIKDSSCYKELLSLF